MRGILCGICVVWASCFSLANCEPDYYWRDYNGKIPKDAVPGGTDKEGDPTYIGQAFIQSKGLLVGQIYPGKRSITVSREGIYTTNVNIKILCSPHKDNFKWISGTASSLHLTTINKHLVAGGTEGGKILSIGRVYYQGQVVVGKVCSGSIMEARMYFPFNNDEIKVDSYEVLTYEEGNIVPVK